MTIEILDYRSEQHKYIQGKFDVKRTMSGGRFVIYRNLVHWNKEGKEWVSPPNTKINDNWEKTIEFDKDTSLEFYKSVLECLKSYFKSTNMIAKNQKISEESENANPWWA